MRTLYIVGGAMGVGKTTTCRLLCERLENSALLDGDWLWDLHPFRVTDVTKRLVCDACFLICDEMDLCRECAARMKEPGEPVAP